MSPYAYQVRDLHVVEKELFRRYTAGDQEAWIPPFQSLGYPAPR